MDEAWEEYVNACVNLKGLAAERKALVDSLNSKQRNSVSHAREESSRRVEELKESMAWIGSVRQYAGSKMSMLGLSLPPLDQVNTQPDVSVDHPAAVSRVEASLADFDRELDQEAANRQALLDAAGARRAALLAALRRAPYRLAVLFRLALLPLGLWIGWRVARLEDPSISPLLVFEIYAFAWIGVATLVGAQALSRAQWRITIPGGIFDLVFAVFGVILAAITWGLSRLPICTGGPVGSCWESAEARSLATVIPVLGLLLLPYMAVTIFEMVRSARGRSISRTSKSVQPWARLT